MKACSEGNLEIARLVLKSGASASAAAAAKNKEMSMLRLIHLRKDKIFFISFQNDSTALHLSFHQKQYEAVKFLIKNGADLEAIDKVLTLFNYFLFFNIVLIVHIVDKL